MSQPSPNEPVASNARSRLHSFGWFIGGVLAVIIFLQIKARFDQPLYYFSEDLATSHRKPHHKAPDQELPSTAPAAQLARTWDSFNRIFVFGDSYSSLWFDPAGKQPSRKDPLGSKNHGTGLNWVKFLTRTHNMTFLRTYDFAVGGSTVDREHVAPFLLGSTFKEQLNQKFRPYYTGKHVRAKWNPKKTLFMMWFGVNDIFAPRVRTNNSAPIADVVKSYEEITEDLYADGARHMIFLTLPPFERASGLTAEEKIALNPDITAFNSRIFEMRTNLQRNHSDLDAAIFDAYSFWSRVIHEPTDFEETKTVKYPTQICMPNGESPTPFPENKPYLAKCKTGLAQEYIWSLLHGTFPIHNATAKRITTDCFGVRGRSGYCS